MPYTVRTKDGITLPNIPDELAPDSAEVRAMVAQARSKRGPVAPSPEQRAAELRPGVAQANLANPAPPPVVEPETTAGGVMAQVNRALLPAAAATAAGAGWVRLREAWEPSRVQWLALEPMDSPGPRLTPSSGPSIPCSAPSTRCPRTRWSTC